MRHTDVNGSSQHSTGEAYFLQFSLPVPFPCSPVCPISITQLCHLFAFYIASLAAHLSPSLPTPAATAARYPRGIWQLRCATGVKGRGWMGERMNPVTKLV